MNNKKYKFYLLFGIVLIAAILTPHIVHGHIWVPEKYAQSVVLALDVMLGYIFYLIYKRDLQKVEDDNRKINEGLLDSYKYIGKMNIQGEMLNSFINSLQNHQGQKLSNKDIFRKLLVTMVFSVAKGEKGMIRFFNQESKRIINEYSCHKEGDLFVPKITINDNERNSRKLINKNGASMLMSDYINADIGCLLCFVKKDGQVIDVKLLKTLLNQTHLLFLLIYSKSIK